jgi:hypothetical protein
MKFQSYVRIEPKFEIPSGEPYTGGWCRPQTDGPALRAMALSKWGMLVKQQAGQPPRFNLVSISTILNK